MAGSERLRAGPGGPVTPRPDGRFPEEEPAAGTGPV